MLEITFQGWFQCRLATDPDPYDEPRGVSGYVRAYVNEPDLDRIIRFQDPPFTREYGPNVDVRVSRVVSAGRGDGNHPLLGARVNLLGDPKFEGRNGVIAEDAFEPIWPFEFSIQRDQLSVSRAIVATDADYPYPEFLARPGGASPGQIAQATGISDLGQVWAEREAKLKQKLAGGLPDLEAAAVSERLEFLAERPGLNFFNASMTFDYLLQSPARIDDPDAVLASVDPASPWPVKFWVGAWDADALCGYTMGTISLPDLNHSEAFSDRSVRRTNVGARLP
jgi:hypothetical protein